MNYELTDEDIRTIEYYMNPHRVNVRKSFYCLLHIPKSIWFNYSKLLDTIKKGYRYRIEYTSMDRYILVEFSRRYRYGYDECATIMSRDFLEESYSDELMISDNLAYTLDEVAPSINYKELSMGHRELSFYYKDKPGIALRFNIDRIKDLSVIKMSTNDFSNRNILRLEYLSDDPTLNSLIYRFMIGSDEIEVI